jgi:hypothetical protein
MKTIRTLPLLLSLAVGQALAGTPIHLQHPATATAHISISNTNGEVHVTAWDRNEVQVEGELGDGARPLVITGSDDAMAIKVQPQGGGGWFSWNDNSHLGPTTLDVRVPRRASLKVDVVSAPLDIDGTDGGSLKINSISGRVRINARTPSLDVNSVSGGIAFAGQATQANLQTVSGDILAPALGKDADLQTISGHIQASGGPWRRLKLSTVSGDAQVDGALAPGGRIGIDSMSGDIDLRLPAALSATLKASSFSGDLRSDFGTPRSSAHGPGSALETTAGSGDGQIEVETFSGDLRIRRKG